MSNGTHFYKFSNLEELKVHLGTDLESICDYILSDGIVFEGQCGKLDSYLIEELGSSMLMELICSETGVDVIPSYSKESRLYYLYVPGEISSDEVEEKCAQWAKDYYGWLER
ncbi:hypothetical protein SAMN05421493_10260 [Pseudobutyrivibrio sp. 49]|uniref:hypothetical protein n=1 Tax=Pseudobutyrivibrio sp. 49 TaxID=1855344 RepID=UPI00089144C8|nr:hypothetical protein [Pseudobutyrivibrio sp. 49]SDH59013.1 hypothetical protein SAMN05421493_10260 [Pseudobutyrivibrio sp. 49]